MMIMTCLIGVAVELSAADAVAIGATLLLTMAPSAAQDNSLILTLLLFPITHTPLARCENDRGGTVGAKNCASVTPRVLPTRAAQCACACPLSKLIADKTGKWTKVIKFARIKPE